MEVGKGLVDGVYCGDDFGTQNGLLFSPEIFRKYIKPKYKKLVKKVHSYGLKYFHHTCGGVRPIIPDFIEIGFDVLNPIQPLAAGMEPGELAEEFGRDIVFYGGIDEQQTLPFGSVADVVAEVTDSVRIYEKARWICAPCHRLQPVSPTANILAMFDTIYRLGDRRNSS
jgi:uroporphyrinogen decarboxylase